MSSRHRLSESFLKCLADDFDLHGKDVIETVREEKPADYLRAVASLLPKQVEVKDATLDDLNDAELAAVIDALRTAREAASERREGSTH